MERLSPGSFCGINQTLANYIYLKKKWNRARGMFSALTCDCFDCLILSVITGTALAVPNSVLPNFVWTKVEESRCHRTLPKVIVDSTAPCLGPSALFRFLELSQQALNPQTPPQIFMLRCRSSVYVSCNLRVSCRIFSSDSEFIKIDKK